MSAIFGIINFDGSPVNIEHARKMQEALNIYTFDNKFLWNHKNAFLCHYQLYSTQESLSEVFPLISENNEIVFFSDARIDNRKELLDKLKINNLFDKIITDAELVFQAYLKWGNNSVDYLLGDWCFIAWHKVENKLFVARDHHGATAFHYHLSGTRLIFCTSLKGILAITNPNPNTLKLAEVCVGESGDDYSTCYEDIFRLPPAHYIIFSKYSTYKYNYWNPENIEPFQERSFNDLGEEYEDILKKSINCRLRNLGNKGSMLSGGLDSGTVTTIAASILNSRNEKIHSYTSIPLYPCNHLFSNKMITNEGYLAGLTANKSCNIDHYLIKSEEFSIIESIRKCIEIHDEPIRNIGNLHWLLSVYSLAQKHGVRTILNGNSGNATLSFPPLFFNEKKKFNKINLHTLPAYIKLNIIKPLTPNNILINYKSQQKIKNSFIKKSIQQKYFLLDRLNYLYSFSNYPLSKALYLRLLQTGQTYYGCFSKQYLNYFGIEILDPTTDKRLIEFSTSLIYMGKKEISPRILLQERMKNCMHNEILFNKQRGIQAGDISERIKQNSSDLEQMIKNFSGEFYLTENKLLLSFLDDLKFSNKTNKSKQAFLRALTVDYFISKMFN